LGSLMSRASWNPTTVGSSRRPIHRLIPWPNPSPKFRGVSSAMQRQEKDFGHPARPTWTTEAKQVKKIRSSSKRKH
jgi:hypothetical protein